MAELNVQPKKPNSWWIWIIIALAALIILIFLFRGCNTNAANAYNSYPKSENAIAVTQPDWEKVKSNSVSPLASLNI